MHIASLSSSSTFGNAYVVWENSKRPLLIDCGLSMTRIIGGLKDLGMVPEDLAGIFVTHEHLDHVRAMCLKTPFPQKFRIPVYASRGFWNWYNTFQKSHIDQELVCCVKDGEATRIAGYTVQSFLKPHDAREPMGFKVNGSSASAGFVMDLGYVPPKVEDLLIGTEYLVFEANYDVTMELNSGRPKFLLDRVMGAYGHLSNEESGKSLQRMVTETTKQVILAHLSMDCNSPDRAILAVTEKVEETGFVPEVIVAPPGSLGEYGAK